MPGDPYYYEVDNLPLQDLVDNDKVLQAQLDEIEALKRFKRSGRTNFDEFSCYTQREDPGKVFVTPGNFISRMNTKADVHTGIQEKQTSGDKPGSQYVDLGLPNFNFGNQATGAAGRTAVVNLAKPDPISDDDWFISIEDFDATDFEEGDAPDARVDLIYVQGYPSMDQQNTRAGLGNPTSTARIGIIKGAFFRSDLPSRSAGNFFSDPNEGLRGRVAGTKDDGLYKGAFTGSRDAETGFIAGNDIFGSVPAPDDAVNYSYKPGVISNLSNWADDQIDKLGVFCLPIAYVVVPREHLAGRHIPQDHLMDIRPFFRTAELTLAERQGFMVSENPSLENRFLTRYDSDYVNLRDWWVRAGGHYPNNREGNHEGRITHLENALAAPCVRYAWAGAQVDAMHSAQFGKAPTNASCRFMVWNNPFIGDGTETKRQMMFMQVYKGGAFGGTTAALNLPKGSFLNLEALGFAPDAIKAMTIHQSGSSFGGAQVGSTENTYHPQACTNADGESFLGIKITARTTHLTLCGMAGTNVPPVDM